LREEGLLKRSLIYATDINRTCCRKPLRVYDVDRIAGFTQSHRKSGGNSSLSDYYTAAYGRAMFDKSLREHIVFSDHSLATDSVSPRCSWFPAATCSSTSTATCRTGRSVCFGMRCAARILRHRSKESLRFSAHHDSFNELVREDRIYQKRTSHDCAETLKGRIEPSSSGLSRWGGSLSVVLPLLPHLSPLVLIVLHLPASAEPAVEIYEKRCALPIREADDKEPSSRGRCISPHRTTTCWWKKTANSLSTDEPVHFSRPSVDVLFESRPTCTASACSGNPNSANEDGAVCTRSTGRRVTVVQQPDSAKAPLM